MSDRPAASRPPEDGAAGCESSPEADTQQSGSARPKEIGGRDGPDPTRYGDWEKAGRCIDF